MLIRAVNAPESVTNLQGVMEVYRLIKYLKSSLRASDGF